MKYMRRLGARLKRNIIAIPPCVLSAVQQIIHQKVFIGRTTDFIEIKARPAYLLVGGIKIDHYQDRIFKVRRGLRVADQLRIIDGMKMQRCV